MMFFLCACQTGTGSIQKQKESAEIQYRQPRVTDLLGPQSQKAQGEIRLLVVPVRFPDVKPNLSLDQIKYKAVTRLNEYVRDQSYGKARIDAHMTGWVLMPDPVSEYRVSSRQF